jgi:hypothetical protein
MKNVTVTMAEEALEWVRVKAAHAAMQYLALS